MMKKLIVLVVVIHLACAGAWAQSNTPEPVLAMDAAVKVLAGNINRRLGEVGVQKVAVGNFVYNGTVSALSHYWSNQLVEELANTGGRVYSILPANTAGEWTVSGEIVEIGNTVRVYTRLVAAAPQTNQTIEGVFHSDLVRTPQLLALLHSGGGNIPSSAVSSQDAYEVDSQEYPVLYEIGGDETVPHINRNIHEDDEDFFALDAQSDGRIVVETTGSSIDTYMELYDANTDEWIAEDDDDGSGTNARIVFTATAGRRYIAMVRGYSSDSEGRYGFRSYYQTIAQPDEFEPDDDASGASEISVGQAQRHTFHTGDDVDWVTFRITTSGRYVIRAQGVSSNELDTVIELYDMEDNLIDEDDDSGSDYDARLYHNFSAGSYRLKIWCYDDEPAEPYTVSVTME